MARGSRCARDRRRGRAVSAARRIRRGRAAPRGRGRARRDAGARRARRGAHARHDRARDPRAHAPAGGGAQLAPRAPARARRSSSTRSSRISESVGFERVTLVDDVAQFSVRGGIVDIYSFGMANPGAPRAVGRRDRIAPPLRSRHAALDARRGERGDPSRGRAPRRGRRRARRAAPSPISFRPTR